MQVQEVFTYYLPNTPVIITFGNNDCKYHYSAPFEADKYEYYDFIYKLWF